MRTVTKSSVFQQPTSGSYVDARSSHIQQKSLDPLHHPMFNDNDILIEVGSNMCWKSGPAGMSDGVMTPRKSIGKLVRC